MRIRYIVDLNYNVVIMFLSGSITGSISDSFPNTVLTSDPVAAPEPLTFSLLGARLAGLAGGKRRKKAA